MSHRVDQSSSSLSSVQNISQGKLGPSRSTDKKAKPGGSRIPTQPVGIATATRPAQANTGARLSDELRRRMIEEAAYYRAEKRGFSGGDEVQDWLAAEAEVNASYPG